MIMGSFFKYFALATFVALFSIIFQAYNESAKLHNLTEILQNLVRLEKVTRKEVPRVVVGYGSCSDLTVNAVEFLNYSDAFSDFSKLSGEKDEILNFSDFMRSFSFYFAKSVAAERYTPNKEMFLKLVALAKKHSSADWGLGGNAPIMGSRFLMEQMEVLLAATMSEKQKKHLINGFDMLKFSPAADYIDDIHLILEYKTGDKFGDFTANRANRYILHSDINNPMISSLDLLDVNSYNPNLFIISGLQMLDNYPFSPPTIRTERIMKVMQQMKEAKKKTLIHFEMASFVQLELFNDMEKFVLPYTDSLGCNEQEIDNLLKVLEHGRISLSADSNPRVATTLDQIRKVFKILNRNYFANRGVDKDLRMLSRVHIHTLAFQLILNVKDSKWKNIRAAAAHSSLVAHRHVCQTSYVNPESSMLILDNSFSTSVTESDKTDDSRPSRIDIKENNPVSCWIEKIAVDEINLLDVKICIAPNLVCKVAKKTVGAGDNISASGLAAQF